MNASGCCLQSRNDGVDDGRRECNVSGRRNVKNQDEQQSESRPQLCQTQDVLLEPRLSETHHAALTKYPLSPHQARQLVHLVSERPYVPHGEGMKIRFISPLLLPVFTSSLTSPVFPPQLSGNFGSFPYQR